MLQKVNCDLDHIFSYLSHLRTSSAELGAYLSGGTPRFAGRQTPPARSQSHLAGAADPAARTGGSRHGTHADLSPEGLRPPAHGTQSTSALRLPSLFRSTGEKCPY